MPQLLPIDTHLPRLVDTLRSQNALVLTAPPGTGKTTRVPPAIIAASLLPKESPHLIMLQPRRVAARASATRIAAEQGWRLGEQVGYHIRFEKRYTPQTRIRILTEAILTRMLLADPELPGIGAVLLDEFHERNIHSDLALAFLRDIQQTIRPDLKILIMSATLDAQPIAKFLGTSETPAPILHVESPIHPLEISYRPAPPARDTPLETHIARTVEQILQSDDTGDLLIFLPGVGEIERARRALSNLHDCLILPLHGSLSSEEQQTALAPAPRGNKKIILATNIAETSLTIDGVRTVIDSGLARVASFDPDRGMDRLDLERISKASATQRAGRAARQGPGRAIRLWPESEQKHLADFNTPEIHRVDLAPTLLAVHAWGTKNPRAFPWFDPPEEEMLTAAEDLLTLLGALHQGTLTETGRHMLQFPAHPRIARLLIAAAGTPLANDALTLAAILSDDSRTTQTNDPLAILHRPPPHLSRIREQLSQSIRTLPQPQIKNQKSKIKNLPDLLLLAYPDRLARRRGADPHAALMVGNIGLRLAPSTLTPALAEAPFFLALDVHHDPRNRKAESTVRAATPIDEEALARLLPEALRKETALEFDSAKQKISAFSRRYFHDLVLEEDSHGRVDPEAGGTLLARALAPRARELFEADEKSARLLARTALLRHHMAEHPWPPFDDAQLVELLAQACAGLTSLAQLRDGHRLADAVRGALVYPLDRLLDQHAPETLEVPSGSRIRVEYAASPNLSPPVLAVRLQELFGLLETPHLAGGRVPVLLHLLSPGYKPIQITSDLRSFWKAAYFEVRKDLRVRYPKHKWPDDPLSAVPEAKGRRRISS